MLKNKTLPLSTNVLKWAREHNLKNATQLRLLTLVICALEKKSRSFFLTKKQFGILLGTKNRATQKNFLFNLVQQGIITILKEDHFQIHFELTQEFFDQTDSEEQFNMEKGTQTALKFENPETYSHQFITDSMKTQSTTKDKYNEMLTDLLAQISTKDILEKMATNETLVKSIREQLRSIKIKIQTFEKRNNIKLERERTVVVSIARILDSIKIFCPESKTYETQKQENRHKLSPKDLVTYFYRQLSAKIQEPIYVTAWPSEIEAAKDVLRQMPDKEPEFVKAYIDWVLQNQHNIKMMFNTRYYVPQYLQVLNDQKFWKPIWENYISKTPNSQGIIIPESDEELACLFAHTYERVYSISYKPLNSFSKDIIRLKQLKTYLGDNFEKTITMIVWCIEKVFHAQNEKPSNPADLYRFIDMFRGTKHQTETPSIKIKILTEKLDKYLRRINARSGEVSDTDKKAISKLLELIPLDQINKPTIDIINKYPEIFIQSGNKITIGR